MSREVDGTEGEDHLLLFDFHSSLLLDLNVDCLLHANLKLILGRFLFDASAAGNFCTQGALKKHFLCLSHYYKEHFFRVDLSKFQRNLTIGHLAGLVYWLHHFERVHVFLH